MQQFKYAGIIWKKMSTETFRFFKINKSINEQNLVFSTFFSIICRFFGQAWGLGFFAEFLSINIILQL